MDGTITIDEIVRRGGDIEEFVDITVGSGSNRLPRKRFS